MVEYIQDEEYFFSIDEGIGLSWEENDEGDLLLTSMTSRTGTVSSIQLDYIL